VSVSASGFAAAHQRHIVVRSRLATRSNIHAGIGTLRGPGALTTAFPAGYVWGKLIAAATGALAGGFTTSRITVGRSMYTVFVLALILFVAAAGPALRGNNAFPNDPAWFPLTLAIVELVAVVIGGLVERALDRAGEKP